MEELKQIDPGRALCFRGHRPDRLPGGGLPDAPETQELIFRLRTQIEEAVGQGKMFFCHGAMPGFDILAAEQVVFLKDKYPHIRLITVAPYKTEFFAQEKHWTPEWIHRAWKIFHSQDMGTEVADSYRSNIYRERDCTLIDHSSGLICYWNGKNGGTKFAVEYARKTNKKVINLAELGCHIRYL